MAAAIALLDEEGVDGLNMRDLGQRLGAAATAVYWHVSSKDNVIALATDAVWAEIAVPPAPRPGMWRPSAEAFARSAYDMVCRHPWLWPAISASFAYGVGMARHQEQTYAIFQAAGFEGRELDGAVNTYSVFIFGASQGVAAAFALRARLKRSGEDAQHLMAELNQRAEAVATAFPALRERMAAHSHAPLSDDDRFAFGLAVVLDGLEARLRRSRAAARRTDATVGQTRSDAPPEKGKTR